MLKHQQFIDKLTVEQKLALMADVTSYDKLRVEGEATAFKRTSLDVQAKSEGLPSFSEIARTWNSELIEKVADELSLKARNVGATTVGLESRVKISPYVDGLTEDSYLNRFITNKLASSVKKAGLLLSAETPLITEEEAVFSDLSVDVRAIKEYIYSAHQALLSENPSVIEIGDYKKDGEYGAYNESLLSELKEKYAVITSAQSSDLLRGGELVTGGNYQALKLAYEKHLKLEEEYKQGKVTLADVNDALNSGSTISLEIIDEAVDKILDFARNLKIGENVIEKRSEEEVKNLYVRTAEESIVLVKNQKLLPLNTKKRICLVGDLADDNGSGYSFQEHLKSALAKKKGSFLGYSKGYGKAKEVDDGLVASARKLSLQAEAVIVVLGYRDEDAKSAKLNRFSKLPANQYALLEKLWLSGRKVIAVLTGDYLYDMSFDKYCSAVLVAPKLNKLTGRGLLRILYGKTSPSGRLTNSYYYNADKKFDDLVKYKDLGRNKVGSFYGYRHYDTAGKTCKYCFGYGLSYTKFEYSKIKVNENTVSFVVKNVGNCAGSETVQIYVGKKKSSVLRPKKELKRFFKVTLKAGQKAKIKFDVRELDLSVYDVSSNSTATESGNYTLYIGSSVKDVMLKADVSVKGKNLQADGAKYSEYFQNVSNVERENYCLEPIVKKDGSLGSGWKGFWLTVIGVLAVCIFGYAYYAIIGWKARSEQDEINYVVFTAIAVIALLFVIIKKHRNIKILKGKSKAMKAQQRNKINKEDLIEELPFEQLFLTEFGETADEKSEEVDLQTASDDYADDISFEFNPDFTANKANSELSLFMKERGIHVAGDSARALLSAFASSRLLILKNDDKQVLENFIRLLGEYFESQTVVEDFSEFDGSGDILHTRVGASIELTNIARALLEVDLDEDKIKIYSLLNVEGDKIGGLFSQLLRYVEQPTEKTRINLLNGDDAVLEMPENVWFTVTLKEGQKVTDIPKHILESACVLDLSLFETDELKQLKELRKLKKAKEKLVEEVKTEEVEIKAETITADTEETSTEIVGEENTEEVKAEEVSMEAVEETTTEIAVEETPSAVIEELNGEDTADEIVEEVVEQEVQEAYDEVALTLDDKEKTPVNLLTYYQFNKLLELAGRDYQLDEALWKHLDKLEDYVHGVDPSYRIHSKLWNRIEKYVAIYLSCGGDPHEALDSVVANHIISKMLHSVINVKLNEKFSNTLENIFGEGQVPHSIKVVKSTSAKI